MKPHAFAILRSVVNSALVPSVLVAVQVTAPRCLEAQRAPTSHLWVGPPVPISGPSGAYHWFTWLAADPDHSGRLMACGIRQSPFTGTMQGFVYQSADGGSHWRLALVDSTTRRVTEETCAFGAADTGYFVAQGWREDYEQPRLGEGTFRLYRSVDGGATWTFALVDSSRNAWFDYARLVVDRTSGPWHGRVYVFGNNAAQIVDGEVRRYPSPRVLSTSVDGGSKLGPRAELPARDPLTSTFPSDAVVTPQGTAIAGFNARMLAPGKTFQSLADTGLYRMPPLEGKPIVARSRDGGRTVDSAVTLARPTAGTLHAFPALAVDESDGRFRGRLYAGWIDRIPGRGSRVLLSISADDGATWSAAHGITRSNVPLDYVRLAVNGDGIVAALWSGPNGACPLIASSNDGGATFGSPVAIDPPCRRPQPSGTEYEAHLLWNYAGVIGDTTGDRYMTKTGFSAGVSYGSSTLALAAGGDGAFHTLWTRQYTDGRLYTATVWTSRPVPRVLPLPPLDVTSRVFFYITHQDYDPVSGVFSADLVAVNKESVPIIGPLVVQARKFHIPSNAARIAVLDADNGAKGVGAFWDLSPGLSGDTLGPYATAGPRRVTFRVVGAAGRQAEPVLLSVELEVYARGRGHAP
jgi:hypothetical protein